MSSRSGMVVDAILRTVQTTARFDTDEAVQKYIEQNARDNVKPYRIPKAILLSYVDRIDVKGTECITLDPLRREDPEKRILFIHGGGYIARPTLLHWRFADRIARSTGQGITVPLYPLMPQHDHIDVYWSVLDVYEDLLKNYDSENITIMGDSAGGGLSLGFSAFARDNGLHPPGKVVLISPWLDAALDNSEIDGMIDKDPLLMYKAQKAVAEMWAASGDYEDYRISPINADLTDLGEISIFAGTHDFLTADSRLLVRKAEAAGKHIDYNEYDGMGHDFIFYGVPESKDAFDRITGIIKGPSITGRKKRVFDPLKAFADLKNRM